MHYIVLTENACFPPSHRFSQVLELIATIVQFLGIVPCIVDLSIPNAPVAAQVKARAGSGTGTKPSYAAVTAGGPTGNVNARIGTGSSTGQSPPDHHHES